MNLSESNFKKSERNSKNESGESEDTHLDKVIPSRIQISAAVFIIRILYVHYFKAFSQFFVSAFILYSLNQSIKT